MVIFDGELFVPEEAFLTSMVPTRPPTELPVISAMTFTFWIERCFPAFKAISLTRPAAAEAPFISPSTEIDLNSNPPCL